MGLITHPHTSYNQSNWGITDHNFIPMYPKFIRKVEAERNCSNLKNRPRFSERYSLTTVRTACCLFLIERFLKLKKPQNWAVQGFPDRTILSGLGFKTLSKRAQCGHFKGYLKKKKNYGHNVFWPYANSKFSFSFSFLGNGLWNHRINHFLVLK